MTSEKVYDRIRRGESAAGRVDGGPSILEAGPGAWPSPDPEYYSPEGVTPIPCRTKDATGVDPRDRHIARPLRPWLAAVRTLIREYLDYLGVDLSFQDIETELAGLPGEYAPPPGRSSWRR
ncbi:MAG: hypothetical protein MZV70_69485 [Desulfobacterales bacterium]|nr:hypothetical protein [Desulfobacterales bacterium]